MKELGPEVVEKVSNNVIGRVNWYRSLQNEIYISSIPIWKISEGDLEKDIIFREVQWFNKFLDIIQF